MPLYNAAPWLESSVQSMLDQTLADFELILCDNASTDASAEICQRLAARDPRVRYHRHARNIGANRNYQSTLDLATGKYFKWASSSDQCSPNYLEECVAALESTPDAALAAGRTVLFSERIDDGRTYERDIALLSGDPAERFAQLFSTMQLNNAFNGVVRLEALRGCMRLGNYGCADLVLMGELALRGKFLLLGSACFYRRMTAQTATALKDARDAERHIEPRATRPLLWQNWIYHFAHFRAALRAPLPAGSRLQLLGLMGRMAIWARKDLAADIAQAARRVV